MKISFRQGIISYPEVSGTGQAFLQVTGGGSSVNILTGSGITTVAFAHRNADYLHIENNDVSPAWTSLPGTEAWLFWDIDVQTAAVTYSFTEVQPTSGPTQPSTLVTDLHWFDTVNNIMKVYDGTRFVEKIRVFAARINGTSLTPVGSNTGRPFAGSQVGINRTAFAGQILFASGKPIIVNTSNSFSPPAFGRAYVFATTETEFVTGGSQKVNAIRLESDVVTARAVGNLAAYDVVKFSNFGQISPAGYNDTTSTTIGIVTDDVSNGSVATVVIQGKISNEQWNWQTAGAELFILENGELTEDDPNLTTPTQHPVSKPPVARVLSQTEIIFMQGLGKVGPRGLNPSSINSIGDVSILGPVEGDVLRYSGTPLQWRNNRSLLDELADVDVSSVIVGEALIFTGSPAIWTSGNPSQAQPGDGLEFGSPNTSLKVNSTVARLNVGSPNNFGSPGEGQLFTGNQTFADSVNFLKAPTINGVPISATTGSPGSNVDAVGSPTPLNNQLAIFTDATTIEGDAGLTWNTLELSVDGHITTRVLGGPELRNTESGSTTPTLIPRNDRVDVGWGSASGSDNMRLILDNNTISSWFFTGAADKSTTWNYLLVSAAASTTQTQGNGPLNGNRFTEVVTVANQDDVITLSAASGGRELVIFNTGANRLQIFPSSGDAILPNAVDTSIFLEVNHSVTLHGLDTTNWIISSKSDDFGSPVGLENVVEDLTPQLGGDLDVNGFTLFAVPGSGSPENAGNINLTVDARPSFGVDGAVIINASAGSPVFTSRLKLSGTPGSSTFIIEGSLSPLLIRTGGEGSTLTLRTLSSDSDINITTTGLDSDINLTVSGTDADINLTAEQTINFNVGSPQQTLSMAVGSPTAFDAVATNPLRIRTSLANNPLTLSTTGDNAPINISAAGAGTSGINLTTSTSDASILLTAFGPSTLELSDRLITMKADDIIITTGSPVGLNDDLSLSGDTITLTTGAGNIEAGDDLTFTGVGGILLNVINIGGSPNTYTLQPADRSEDWIRFGGTLVQVPSTTLATFPTGSQVTVRANGSTITVQPFGSPLPTLFFGPNVGSPNSFASGSTIGFVYVGNNEWDIV